MLEPHLAESLRPSSSSIAPAANTPDRSATSRVAAAVLRLRGLGLVALVVLDVDGDDAARAVAEVEDEGGVERPQAVEVGRVEPPRRVGEAHLARRCRARRATTCARRGRRRARSAARSPNRLNASAADDSRSAHSRWWSKLWCASTNAVRARAASGRPA